MRSSDDSILSSSRNAFSPSFLHRIGENDEPPTAGEADAAGPWRVLELPGRGFGLFRIGESPERGHRPAARFRQRWLALLLAALRNGVIPAIRKSGVFGCRGSAASVGVGEVCDVAGV
ncbi:MAG TPA: hypothetical protein VIE43_17860 [Thermoanaerobaculia bacterium]|nr:hypothetical protein [Thermoanaerobaculia bacterium]